MLVDVGSSWENLLAQMKRKEHPGAKFVDYAGKKKGIVGVHLNFILFNTDF